MYSFPSFEPARCSCPALTLQVSQEAGQVRTSLWKVHFKSSDWRRSVDLKPESGTPCPHHLPAHSTGSGGSYKAKTNAYKYLQHTSAPTEVPPFLERRQSTFGLGRCQMHSAWHRNKRKNGKMKALALLGCCLYTQLLVSEKMAHMAS